MDTTLAYFDKAARGGIRDALRRYMKDNRIGTPKLRDLIAEANGIAPRRDGKEPIALSTVQRFIADTHRANDSFVGLCARFVEGLPEITADPLAAFGEQVSAFLGVEHGAANVLPVPPEIAGAFTCRAELGPIGRGHLRLRPKPDGSHLVPFSDMDIERLPDRPFAVIRETIVNWTAMGYDGPDPDLETQPRRFYEGVMIRPNGQLLALMRNTLSRTPRIYWLALGADDRLVGDGHEPFASLDRPRPADDPLHISTRIMATPVREASDG